MADADEYEVRLSAREVANLRSWIEATGWGPRARQAEVPPSPLEVLQTGQWIAQVYFALPEVETQPSHSPSLLAKNALAWEPPK